MLSAGAAADSWPTQVKSRRCKRRRRRRRKWEAELGYGAWEGGRELPVASGGIGWRRKAEGSCRCDWASGVGSGSWGGGEAEGLAGAGEGVGCGSFRWRVEAKCGRRGWKEARNSGGRRLGTVVEGGWERQNRET